MERGRGRASLGPRGSFKGLQMWVELETHLGLLMSQPQLLHICLPPLATSDPRGPRGTACCFQGLGVALLPLHGQQKPPSVSQPCGRAQQLRPRKGVDAFWFLHSAFSPRIIPLCAFRPHFSPSAALQHQLKKFLGHSHLGCVPEVAGVFSPRQGERGRNVCGWHDV